MSHDEKSLDWLKFYPADHSGDHSLRMCSLAARGLWIALMTPMHKAQPYGHLLVNGRIPSCDELAVIASCTAREVEYLLGELLKQGAASVTADGVIFSRRMVRDHARRVRNQANAQKAVESPKHPQHARIIERRLSPRYTESVNRVGIPSGYTEWVYREPDSLRLSHETRSEETHESERGRKPANSEPGEGLADPSEKSRYTDSVNPKSTEYRGTREGDLTDDLSTTTARARAIIEGRSEPPSPLRNAPLIRAGHHQKHAECGVVCLHAAQFEEFVSRARHEEDPNAYVREFFVRWNARYTSGDRAREIISEDAFDFWRARWAETHPPKQTPKPGEQRRRALPTAAEIRRQHEETE